MIHRQKPIQMENKGQKSSTISKRCFVLSLDDGEPLARRNFADVLDSISRSHIISANRSRTQLPNTREAIPHINLCSQVTQTLLGFDT
uniref:Uncharacterized protein n=1 Tax=Lactuca sativa TaxID=4236 RepID=A0A9R1X1N6_LACSA|nr:hypothetical protein LSAT_V11C700359180 [Lactuca sativa]